MADLPTKIKTRFAPSPTGDLHLGGARTALYCWLFARNNGGEFLLRIEDTDRERSTQEAIDVIIQGMKWLGLEWDEGPFYQTKRFARYYEVLEEMLERGSAYKCYCSHERLAELREQQMLRGEKPRYDGHCRDRLHHSGGEGESHVIRFRNPADGEVSFVDQVRGQITFQNCELDDLIIMRSDRTPTYNFCVVVDDWDMEVTDIIRGEDHITNTARQINILRAMGAPIPRYSHLSMILGPDGHKLSKRHGAVSLLQYRDDGYLPHAMLNYLLRLGWSMGDQEIFSIEEMQRYFSIAGVNLAAGAFNPEKLLWLNHHYINHSDRKIVAQHLQWQLQRQSLDATIGPPLEQVVELLGPRCNTLKAMASSARYLFQESISLDEVAVQKYLSPSSKAILQSAHERLASLTNWGSEEIQQIIRSLAELNALPLSRVAMPLRVAVTGVAESPAIAPTMQLVGQRRTLARIAQAAVALGG